METIMKTNKDYYDLYMWLNREKVPNTQFDQQPKELRINTFNTQVNQSSLYSGASRYSYRESI